jgi:hypothetical protein
MLWLLLGCASHRLSLPLAAVHYGPDAEPPVLPLQAVWIEAVDDSCSEVVSGLRFAWTVHADQIIHPDASIHLNIQNCGVELTERIRPDARRSQETGVEQLDALLTGRGWATVFIERGERVLEVVRVEALQIEQESWIGGQRYTWREPLTASVVWSLAEELEAELLPLAVLRVRPHTEVLMAAGEELGGRSWQTLPQSPPEPPLEEPLAMQ